MQLLISFVHPIVGQLALQLKLLRAKINVMELHFDILIFQLFLLLLRLKYVFQVT